ncbi:MAG TPA: Ku protein [Gammaproteobacteria bacterium]|nr:Ku protein [Gammaproteobacteria bacterium]
MPRVLWKGVISFGLVNMPIRMYTAIRDRSLRFHMLTQDGSCRLRQKLYCPETGKEYNFNETARGYEVAPDQYVLLDDEEIRKLLPETGRNIEIEDFVALEEIDPIRYNRPYFLAPAEGGSKPYRLLIEAMERTGKVGIARFVLHNKQHLAAVRVMQGGLALSTMYWPDEVLALQDVVAVPEDKVDAKQIELANNLIEAMTKSFDPARYTDTYREKLAELIERKAEGKRIPLPSEPQKTAQVVDLMEALKRSLEKSGQKAPRKKSGTHPKSGAGQKNGGRKKTASR